MKNILVLCTGNSCRSQIAHGFLENLTDGRSVKVFSAGVETHGVNPKAITTMAEIGIDISKYTSNHVEEYFEVPFDFVITVCDNALERCPYFPTNGMKLHYNFPDPAKYIGNEADTKAEFARVRNLIKDYCEKFVQENLKN
jgi:arsenate reductase (thioredoxin)